VKRSVLSTVTFAAVTVVLFSGLFGGLWGHNDAFGRWANPLHRMQVLSMLRAAKEHQYARVDAFMDSSVPHPTRAQVDAVAGIIPNGPYSSLQTVSAWTTWQLTTHERREFLEYEILYPKACLLVDAVILSAHGRAAFYSFQVQPLRGPLEQVNLLRNGNPGFFGFIIAVLTLSMLGFIVWTMTVCLQSSIRWKPAWVVAIAVGLGRVTLTWATGAVGFEVLHIMIPAASMGRSSAFSPWYFTLGIPAGAIAFWVLHAARPQTAEEAPAPAFLSDQRGEA
jgi:hypothetical protein